MIVAIDGPAGSGKSTTARRVAERLGWLYLDTGAMYRAVGLAFREQGLPVTEAAASGLVPGLDVRLEPGPGGTRVALDGDDVTDRIRTPEASRDASRVSALAPVRAAMVALQRRAAHDYVAAHPDGGVVVEGRDIGTVVFPGADVKFFLVADLDARARRRLADDAVGPASPDGPDAVAAALDQVRAELAERDRRDESRDVAPLKAAPDAVTLDTTALTIDQQVESVLDAVRRVREPSTP
ncbi:(d)CMP kinase [Rubrivirga marina]|uniref:Cytidylate kinase n=1 Tax=Rubrivirga marina TaxID=1196024 RepID=A0A271J3K2_9BACT|nr:(d)CMP kinase [Rubrivirga marina]PAP77624.1 cytidylate kinase [Rubrivirga marina]